MSRCIEVELLESRRRLQGEVRTALGCKTKKQKVELVKKWQAKYSPVYVQELINLARNKDACADVLEWELEKM